MSGIQDNGNSYTARAKAMISWCGVGVRNFPLLLSECGTWSAGSGCVSCIGVYSRPGGLYPIFDVGVGVCVCVPLLLSERDNGGANSVCVCVCASGSGEIAEVIYNAYSIIVQPRTR